MNITIQNLDNIDEHDLPTPWECKKYSLRANPLLNTLLVNFFYFQSPDFLLF